MKIVFMGTPSFSVPSLEKFINSKNHNVIAIFTKEDKANKRGNKIEFSPVKKVALKYNIPVFQPPSLKSLEVYEKIKNLNPDVILVVAYGKILPKNILNLPKYGCINLHGSLLPKYRGAAPIQRAIINGESETGITTMFMNEGMDTGDILFKEQVKISESDSSLSLFQKLSLIGADLLLKTVTAVQNGSIKRIEQDNKHATFAPPIKKEEALISWNNMDAKSINNLIRGLDAGPTAYTSLNKKRIKLFKSSVSNSKSTEKPGTIISENPLTVMCKNNTALKILELQPENKRKMTAEEYVKGNRILWKVLE